MDRYNGICSDDKDSNNNNDNNNNNNRIKNGMMSFLIWRIRNNTHEYSFTNQQAFFIQFVSYLPSFSNSHISLLFFPQVSQSISDGNFTHFFLGSI
jgi:hypothetical protein